MQLNHTGEGPPNALPKIAVTMGDPAGIGPEICVRMLADSSWSDTCIPVVLGDVSVLKKAAELLGIPLIARIVARHDWPLVCGLDHAPTIVDFGDESLLGFEEGKVSAACGRASLAYLYSAIDAAQKNQVDAITTGPIHKEAIHAAGSPHIGHTEILAEATQALSHLMMLSAPEITCSLVTAHVGLAEVAGMLSVDKVVSAMELTVEAMRRMRGIQPRLTVCGLNPHAGEGGLLGRQEEEQFIIPAIETMRKRGIEVTGPMPPDTAFLPARRAQTDAYICMYHDQGLIPLKMLAFDKAINITLGLPIIRTSVDHGTAFDIAWKGVASASSMIEAIRIAALLSRQGSLPFEKSRT